MIRGFNITNPKGEQLYLDMFNPWDTGIAIHKVEGLGPAKANVNTVELATSDGALFSSSRVTKRNIVFTFDILGAPSVETSRQLLYRYFPLKKSVDIQIITDNRMVHTSGYVETSEPNIFSEAEDMQISIICPDPYFYGSEIIEKDYVRVHPVFEFPFENNSLTENLIEFGEIWMDNRDHLEYEGEVDTGVVIHIHSIGRVEGEITFYNMVTKEIMRLDTGKIEDITGTKFQRGDDILISTVRHRKYVRLLRDGRYVNVIAAMDKDSKWFQLTRGMNIFGFTAETGEKNLMVTFRYNNCYGGI